MPRLLPLRGHGATSRAVDAPQGHRLAGALALAAFLDATTFLLLPQGAEANPIAASQPGLALIAKAALAVALVLWPWRYGSSLRLIAVSVWTAGALSNLLVLMEAS